MKVPARDGDSGLVCLRGCFDKSNKMNGIFGCISKSRTVAGKVLFVI